MNDGEPMRFPRCRYTGVTIPECSCRSCCEEQLRRNAPWLLTKGRHVEAVLPEASRHKVRVRDVESPKADPVDADRPATSLEDALRRMRSARPSEPAEHCLAEELVDQSRLALLRGAC
jgi:hypothetical protein